MDSENVKAIELNGIVHNATKIGVQDGDCEDLVNLRFKDGSWRASGDGKHMFSMQYQSDVANTSGLSYTQLYIHTNVYRHILGVRESRLYWFGTIDTDGVFEALDTPAELTSVSGDLYICQTGHLLTIIDDAGGFEYLLFKPADTLYKKLYVDENGSQTDRGVYPFGQIHFNWADAGTAGTITEDKTDWAKWGDKKTWDLISEHGLKVYTNGKIPDTDTLHNEMVTVYGKAREKNYFTDPFLVCAAIKLYDGKYMYASAPTMIFPRQRAANTKNRLVHTDSTSTDITTVMQSEETEIIDSDGVFVPNGRYLAKTVETPAKDIDASAVSGTVKGAIIQGTVDITNEKGEENYGTRYHARIGNTTHGVFCNGVSSDAFYIWSNTAVGYGCNPSTWQYKVYGVNLCLHIDDDLIQIMRDNEDIFQSLCIFVTTQSSVYDMDKSSDNIRVSLDCVLSDYIYKDAQIGASEKTRNRRYSVANCAYIPTRRKDNDIRYDLLHSPFYLLREYTLDELPNLLNNPVVDLTDAKYKGLLENITQQNTLSVEASSRYSYLPKAQYNYNGRLHIANYTQTQFHGYPLDTFHLNNHSLQYKSGEQFMETLDNVISYHDDTLSEPRTKYSLKFSNASSHKGVVSAYVTTEIETADGLQKVCRYIPLGGNRALPSGDFIEQPAPLLTFPDNRAKRMTISIVQYTPETNITLGSITKKIPATTIVYSKTFDLTAHTSLNMAYYMTDDLLPAMLTATKYESSGVLDLLDPSKSTYDFAAENALKAHTAPAEERVTENCPNGLKVSSTNNPLYFPVENTYQVGSAEIVAMMSNSVAVGTGQTGAAPLYVFCKDGVYALFVDEKGEMAYTNSRVIARDVCNNAKSVTPIDSGVVFTTDRGLMEIAGEQVDEIGQPLEGDWAHFTTAGHIDYSKIAKNAYYMKQIAGLPDESVTAEDSMTQTDFLSYLKGCIINYNHNEFELMVSNPNYNYTYILDKQGNWSRRDIRAEEYVNNYPTSYRVAGNEWYQVDKQSDADNGIYLMSHIIKLDSIGFKELHRVVARGYWQTTSKKEYKTIVIPESNKTIELSPATATIDAWQDTLSAASYTKTYNKQLYRYDIPASVFDRELVCKLEKQTLSFKCVEGCSIDTDKDNEIEITYTIYQDYADIDSHTITNECKVAEDGITITTPEFTLTNDLEANKNYYVIIAVSGTIDLKGDNILSSEEFSFERFIYGDNTCPLANTRKSGELVENNKVSTHTISTKATELCFDMVDVPEAYIEAIDTEGMAGASKYLVIPEGYTGELTLSFSTTEEEIYVREYINNEEVSAPCIISNYTDGTGTYDVTQPTFALQIIKETDDGQVEVVYEKALNFLGFGNETDTGTTTQMSSVAYTVYSHLRVGIYGEEKTLLLTAGKYRQRIVSTIIYTTLLSTALSPTEAKFYGLEFDIKYNCVIANDKQEKTKYDLDSFYQYALTNTTVVESDDTTKLVNISQTILLPMSITYNSNPKFITYHYDADGNAIGFTIPEGMSASLSMKFYGGDAGLICGFSGKQSDGSQIDILDTFESSAGDIVQRIIDSDGNIVWSDHFVDLGLSPKGDMACECSYGPSTVESKDVVTIELPAGTYRTELVLSDIELCMGKSIEGVYNFSLDYDIEASLFVGYTRNTYGMEALTIPDITQTTVLTIPEHTETIVDTDTTYEGILGLYIFGSYDGRKWSLLGHREKSGDFRDIGALVERTDCRFFRFVLAGPVSKDSRFDYLEVSSRKSKLNGKIR